MKIQQLIYDQSEKKCNDILIIVQELYWQHIHIKNIAHNLLIYRKIFRIILLLIQAWIIQYNLTNYTNRLILVISNTNYYWNLLLPSLCHDGHNLLVCLSIHYINKITIVY